MAWNTLSGLNPSGSSSDAVQPSGLYELTENEPLIAADQNRDFQDLQELARQSELAGVMIATSITATGLTIAFAAGFLFFARQIWLSSGTTTYGVPDEANTYLWGCVDGIIRPSASASVPPAGFDNTTACLLVKCSAHLGVVTLDLSVQHRSRYADPTARKVTDGPLTLDYGNGFAAGQGAIPLMDNVPAGATVNISSGFQYNIFESLTIVGTLNVSGKARVTQ